MSDRPHHQAHHECTSSPDESVHAAEHANVNKTVIRVDASALSIIALMLSVAAIVIVIAQSISIPQITDAKIHAAVASTEAQANEAKVNARVAGKDVDKICAALKAAKVADIGCN